MPDQLRAADLDDRHKGRRIRVDGHEGVLALARQIDDEFVQLLLVTGDAHPILPTVGVGAPVELLDP